MYEFPYSQSPLNGYRTKLVLSFEKAKTPTGFHLGYRSGFSFRTRLAKLLILFLVASSGIQALNLYDYQLG